MLKFIVEKFKAIRNEYLERSPKGKWQFVLNIAKFALKIIGFGILDPKFKVKWYTFSSGLVFLDCMLSFIYTMWYYWSDTPLKGLLFISLLGIVIPVRFSFYPSSNSGAQNELHWFQTKCIFEFSLVFFKQPMMIYVSTLIPSKRLELQSLVNFSGENVYPDINATVDRKYIKMCDKNAIKLFFDTMKTLGIIIGSNLVLLILASFAYIYKHDIQLPVPVLLPITDLESINGLTINSLNQIFVSFIAFAGLIGIEITTCVLRDSLLIITASMCFAIDEMSEKIIDPMLYRPIHTDYHFRNILVQAQDFDRWILKLLRIFYWRLLLQPIMLSFNVTFALFFYMHGIWMSGLGVAFFSYNQLYIQCDFGDTVRSSNEKLISKLSEMPWYMMSKKSQLGYVHLLNRLQNGAVFRMGPFAELNFETLSNMTKRIYSFLAMLLRIQK